VHTARVHNPKYTLPVAWEDAIIAWLTWLQVGGTPHTTRRLRRGHLRFIARASRTSHPAELSLAMIVRICHTQPWSNEHRRSVRRSLISFYDWAVHHRLVATNPAADFPRVPGSKPHPRPVPDHLWRDLKANADPRELMMAKLACEVGMRRAEVARCRRDDLLHDVDDQWALLVHGKGDKQRVVPITDRLAAEIIAFCPSGYLFPNGVGGHLTPEHVGKCVGRLLPPGWSMHKLRHRFASRGLAGTGDLLAVRDALGHASVATTQLYTAVADGRVRRVCEAAADD
jgi:integrase